MEPSAFMAASFLRGLTPPGRQGCRLELLGAPGLGTSLEQAIRQREASGAQLHDPPGQAQRSGADTAQEERPEIARVPISA